MGQPTTAQEAVQHNSWVLVEFDGDSKVKIENTHGNGEKWVPKKDMRDWKVKKLVGDKY
jgi:hypothetical protein